jgi:hypothetical protein
MIAITQLVLWELRCLYLPVKPLIQLLVDDFRTKQYRRGRHSVHFP